MQFEVGQEVAIRSGYVYNGYRIATVERITPSGQIIVSGTDRRFRPNGHVMGNSTEVLVPLTDELRRKIRHRELAQHLATVRWQELPLEALEAVAVALGQ